MARKSEPSNNPIRKTRLDHHKTLEEFARECHVHIQAVYLNEMGMYPTVLPSIAKRLVTKYGFEPGILADEYDYYVLVKRYRFKQQHAPYVLGEPDLTRNPLRAFRNSLGYNTVFGFANALAINPTIVRRVESCKVDILPRELKKALADVGLPVDEINELEYQHQEFFHSGIRLPIRRNGNSSRNDY